MSTTVRTLPPSQESHPPALGVHDILFVFFKHKRTILICSALGLLAAAATFFFYPPVYQSQAKLLVRYFVERSAVDAVDTTSSGNRSAMTLQPAIASEVQILTSWDLAVQVAEAIGAKRLLPDAKGTPSNAAAAGIIANGLKVEASKETNILLVSYASREPQLTTLVLQELVNRYFVKHLEVHRSAGAFDFVTQQTDQVRARLNQTEDALKPLNERAGIISLAEGRKALIADLAGTEDRLHAAEAEFAEQQARVQELAESPAAASDPAKVSATKPKSKSVPPVTEASQSPVAKEDNTKPSPTPGDRASSGQIQQYKVVVASLAKLRQTRLDLLSKYTPGSVQVQLTQTQINDLEIQRTDLEKKFPELPETVPKNGSTDATQPDFASERAKLAGIAARVEVLKARLLEVQAKVKQLAELGPQIANLERNKELEEANYKYFQGTLEKSRIDEALDPSKIPNISAVQKPSPPALMTGPRKKLAFLLAGAGLALGLVIALVSDLVLNRTVKRPLELERHLHAPLLLSIPYTPANGRLRLPAKGDGKEIEPYRNANGSNGAAVAPWSVGHFIRPYCEAIRDRFGLYFELNQLTHKPKLVGVTSFSHSAGTSTLAAGLASALSETDEGKVLLVDVNLGPGDVHPFFKGKPAYSLATALQPSGTMDAAAENLYLATVGSAKSGPAQLGLKRFFDLMPNLKASDFDYIIFDMPPLEQTSPTWALSPFMDKMLLIVQCDTTNREVVKRGYSKLVGGRDNVSVVFNKAQSYGPKWISGED
ncbi:MAG: polysaccharide biosynthesis transport protein [Verrucomicrobiota bacterium]